ncbi:MAG: hypothetical protein V1808_00145 [Candidatus Daviesbacteria bacterium]
MITLIIILLLLSFIQASLLPWNFVLLILISRFLIVDDKANLYLAFGFGLLLSSLLNLPWGSLSLLYLSFLLIVNLIKKAPFAGFWLIILPLALVILVFNQLMENVLTSSSFQLFSLVPQVILVIPIYFLMRFWEERYRPRQEIKLKMGK